MTIEPVKKSMKQIIVVTHAQSQHHLDHVVGGWHDSSLSKLGELQAIKIAKRLKNDFPVDGPKVFSSDLKRAEETAVPICEMFEAFVRLKENLREMSYG